MLRALDISDILIIDRLELTFQPGLTVLTGETGAGKSILLESLGFVLGWRGRAELVRQGATQGEVVAVFELPDTHPVHQVLKDAGLPGGNELILRRVNTADGRKTAWVNDRRCSGEALRALSEKLVELHGQHDDRGLLDPRGHRTLLDDFGQLAAPRKSTRTAWVALNAAQKAVADTKNAIDAIRGEEEFLRHAVAELDALDPQQGEDAELDTKRRAMQGAVRIREDVQRAADLLGSDGAETALADAMRWLDGAVDQADGTLDAPLSALNRAMIELGQAQSDIETSLQTLDVSPFDLETIEERLFEIRALARKHDIHPDALPELAQTLRARLTALDAGDADLARRQSELDAAEVIYAKTASGLSNRRAKAAQALDGAVTAELKPLKMERAAFLTELTEAEPGPDGHDTVTFTIATNPGAPSGPLNRIASGGELSRFLLALKVCLSRRSSGLTMIFDEIDRGVGGATADAVGRRLSDLAEGGQVLVVTHSPQVAARGAHHWRVEKATQKGTTLTRVLSLSETERADEIARMLAGDTVTEEARAAARKLLAG